MDVLLTAVGELMDPFRLGILVLGVIFGLALGVIPGLGGIFGLTLLIPVTYTLDPVAAFALLLGMASVTTTSDTIPAVMIGVPGTVGAAATVLDGHALAKKGQAARALGAAYSASMIGGVFGALVLALSLPFMRPLVLLLNYGDLLAITAFGLTLVSMLSGRSPLKGVIAALFGALVAYSGLDPVEGEARWTFGQVYLWEGVPTAILFLGLFGLPELANLLRRGQIQSESTATEKGGLGRGIRDTLRNWPLVLRSSAIGSLLGAVPGVGVTVIEWVAYGDAARRPGKDVPLGEGNIRGVIAPESANNSKEGGSLLPTLAFGIPGSAPMAILLGAFMIHGIVPGPSMLTDHAPLLVSMVLAIALANVIGAGICLGMTGTLARLATVPATSLVPIALVFVVLGALQTNRVMLDLVTLLTFGAIGLAMGRLGWPRPAFALGFVLGPNLERFFFLTYQISGWEWLAQPMVIVVLAVSAAMLIRQLASWRRGRLGASLAPRGPDIAFTALVALGAAGCLVASSRLPFAAGIFPAIIAGLILVCAPLLMVQAWRRGPDLGVRWQPLSDLGFMAAVAGLGLMMFLIGHVAGPVAFIGLAALWFGRPGPMATLITMGAVGTTIYIAFDLLLVQTWPKPWLLSLVGF